MLAHPSSCSGYWTLVDRKIATRLQEVRKWPRHQSEIGRLGRLRKLSDLICIQGRERGRMGSAWKKNVLKRAFVMAVAQRRNAWPGKDSLNPRCSSSRINTSHSQTQTSLRRKQSDWVHLVGKCKMVLFEAFFFPMLKLRVQIAAMRMELGFAWHASTLEAKD